MSSVETKTFTPNSYLPHLMSNISIHKSQFANKTKKSKLPIKKDIQIIIFYSYHHISAINNPNNHIPAIQEFKQSFLLPSQHSSNLQIEIIISPAAAICVHSTSQRLTGGTPVMPQSPPSLLSSRRRSGICVHSHFGPTCFA